MTDYAKRLVEVDVVLDHLSEDDYNKIPEEIIKAIKENKDKNYNWEYNEEKELKDQGLDRDTIAILSYINMEYLLNAEQKALMEEIHEYNEKQLEEFRRKQYDADKIFETSYESEKNDNKKDKISINNNTPKNENSAEDNNQNKNIINENAENKTEELIVPKENIFVKLINKIISFFKK